MDAEDGSLALLKAAGNPKETEARIEAMRAERIALEKATSAHNEALALLNTARDEVAAGRNALNADRVSFGKWKADAENEIRERFGRVESEEARVNELRATVDRQKVEQANEESRLRTWRNELATENDRLEKERAATSATRANVEAVAAAVRTAVGQLKS